MGHRKYPLDLIYTMAAAAGDNDLSMPPVGSGLLYCIQRITVENETSGAADVRLLKGGAGSDLMLAEEDQVQAATLYWIDEVFYIHEAQYITARWTGCTASDRLRMVLLGWYAQIGAGRGD